jgi:AhpD family alkylhydroperoxidase
MATNQSRIALLERDQVPPQVGAIYDVLLKQRGAVPNMFKALAHSPALAQGVAGFLKPLLSDGALPGWYKELVATRAAILHKCEYLIRSHSSLAKQKGASPEQIAGLDAFQSGPYTEREKLGFQYADSLHRSAHDADDAFHAELHRVFSDAEIIELTAAAATFEMLARIVDALRIPTTLLPGETQKAST